MRSTKFLAIIGILSSAAAAQAQPVFFENFENGSSSWNANDGNPIVLSSDAAVCSTTFQHETVSAAGGRVFTNNNITVVGGADYCLSAWVRASSGAQPFLGFYVYDSAQTEYGSRWPIGVAGYNDGFGDQVVGVTGDDAWHWYVAPVT
ncbi:MAG TPA: hypothetical protein VHB97_06970, partial [Polyangia bacterium]|nr:hypothetical protein [Polyangia bacterium]